jgi:hypothetical protein
MVTKMPKNSADSQIAAIYSQLANQLTDGNGVTGMSFNNAKRAVGQSYDTGGALSLIHI